MLLKTADGPHVVDRLFNAMTKGTGLVVAIHHDHHLLSVHDGAYTYCQCGLRNQVDIIVEKTTVGDDGIGGEGLLAGATLQAGAWLVEGDMAVGANAAHEQVNTTCCP